MINPILLIIILISMFAFPAQASNAQIFNENSEQLKEKGTDALNDNQYINALKLYTSGLKAAQRENNKKTEAECNNNIGIIYAVFKDYEMSQIYLERSFRQAQEQNDSRLMMISAINLVNVNASLNNIDKTEKYAKAVDSLAFFPKLSSFYHAFNSGQIAFVKKDYPTAIENYRKARAISANDSLGLSTTVFQAMANAFKECAQTDSAIKYYTKVAENSLKNNLYEETCDVYLDLAQLYRMNDNPEKVIFYQDAFISLSDSLFNVRSFNTAKAQLNDYENNVRNFQLWRLRTWMITLCILIAFMLITICIIVYYYRKLRTSRIILVKTNEELLRSIEDNNNPVPPQEESIVQAAESNRRQQLISNIKKVLNDKTVIFNPDFSLQSLTDRVNSNTKYVSSAINEEFNMNFKSLLNGIRIKEACRLMMNDEEYGNQTIAAIAQSAGYNSINNFISVFKKAMGMTPSQYREYSRLSIEQQTASKSNEDTD